MLIALLAAALADAGDANAGDGAVRAAQDARVAVIGRIAPSVVCVFAPKGDNGGSGVLINAEGEALTNFHVVAGLGPFIKCGLPDGQLYWAVVKAVDPTGDLALIRLLGTQEMGEAGDFKTDFPHATLGDSSRLQPGDPALVLGNPFLLADDYQPTVTFGVVSGTQRYQYPSGTFLEYTDCIQTDAAINPGNSGGPLFDAAGDLVGINGRASFEKRGRVYTGAGYAISINQAKFFLDHLRSGRIADHGTAAMTVATTADGRALVDRIESGSDPERLGIAEGDEVIRFGGRPIGSANAFKNVLGIYPAGWRVPLTVRDRDGETKTVAIRLEPLHTETELIGQTAGNPFGGPPLPGVPTAASLARPPKAYAALHEAEDGFTNRHWNTVETDRTLRVVRDWSVPDAWRLSGTTDAGADATLGLSPKGLAIKAGQMTAALKDEAEPSDVPAGTGGLLVAVRHLQAMLHDPDGFFTDFHYLGSEPLLEPRDPVSLPEAPRVDTMLGTRGEIVSRFHFDPETAALVAMETQLSPDVDPCRIAFGEPQEFDGVTLPGEWTVRHGGRTIATLLWESAAAEASAAESKGN